MGMSLITKEFYAFQGISNKEKFKVQIKSEIQFLAAYFKQFPFLTFYLICGEKLIGSGSMGLQVCIFFFKKIIYSIQYY